MKRCIGPSTVTSFLELLQFYLRSTFVEYAGDLSIQKEGVCIGSCLAPIFRDLLLARVDRQLQEALSVQGILKTFQFVEDLLVVFELDNSTITERAEEIFATFVALCDAFTLTRELPSDGQFRFLDLVLLFRDEHTCWEYAPRSQKGLLPFSSSHGKLVKMGVARGVLRSALPEQKFQQGPLVGPTPFLWGQ